MGRARQNISRAARLRGYLDWAMMHRSSYGNPRKELTLYDPRIEQVRAMQQGMYESKVLGVPKDQLRDDSGMRDDVKRGLYYDSGFREQIHQAMFRMGTGVAQRLGFLEPDTKDVPTARSAFESAQRYQDVDHLMLNRQDYEETLGFSRVSDFYRTTYELTARGPKYLVWPLRPGDYIPRLFDTEAEANEARDYFNAHFDPRRTRSWWKPPRHTYTKKDLKHWLPPSSSFDLGQIQIRNF